MDSVLSRSSTNSNSQKAVKAISGWHHESLLPRVSNTGDDISLANGSSKNKIYDNKIINSVNALRFNADSRENILYSNKIINNTPLHSK